MRAPRNRKALLRLEMGAWATAYTSGAERGPQEEERAFSKLPSAAANMNS